MYVFTYIYPYHVCIHTHMYICIYTHMYISIYTHMQGDWLHTLEDMCVVYMVPSSNSCVVYMVPSSNSRCIRWKRCINKYRCCIHGPIIHLVHTCRVTGCIRWKRWMMGPCIQHTIFIYAYVGRHHSLRGVPVG